MIGHIVITYTGFTPKMPKREWNNILKQAWLEVGWYWKRQILPKHFTRAGAREYGYKPRVGEPGNPGKGKAKGFKSRYTGRKLKRYGHTNPLVWSGKGKQVALSRGKVTATGTRGGGCRVPVPGPWNWKNPHSKIVMKDEIRKISKRDATKLAKVLGRGVRRGIGNVRSRQVKTLRAAA